MAYEQITSERRDHVALVTLNRPDRLNAWTPRMSRELWEAFEAANAEPEIGAIVVTGAGKGFCAGADVRDAFQKQIDHLAEGPDAALEPATEAEANWVDLVRRSKPLVAAVNGAAVGVGFTMILPFDVILASDRARFGMFFIRMGLVPELASTHFLVQRAGWAHASEMCLSGRLVGADEAAQWGIANRVVPHDALVDEALALAAGIAANPAPQLGMIKQLLTANGSRSDLGAVQKMEAEYLMRCYRTPEHKEAVAAFLAKRKPDFRRST